MPKHGIQQAIDLLSYNICCPGSLSLTTTCIFVFLYLHSMRPELGVHTQMTATAIVASRLSITNDVASAGSYSLRRSVSPNTNSCNQTCSATMATDRYRTLKSRRREATPL